MLSEEYDRLMGIHMKEFDKAYDMYKDGNFHEAVLFIKETLNCSDEYAEEITKAYIQDEEEWLSSLEKQPVNIPRCPTCGSTNIRKISGITKAGSVLMFGIFSQKVRHQFRCVNCGYEW